MSEGERKTASKGKADSARQHAGRGCEHTPRQTTELREARRELSTVFPRKVRQAGDELVLTGYSTDESKTSGTRFNHWAHSIYLHQPAQEQKSVARPHQ